MSKKEQNQHNKISLIKDIKEKTAKVICECNGKTELQDFGGNTHKHIVGEKTGGWVNKWIEFYFEKYISPLDSVELKLAQIKSDFPSLTNTLQIIANMVK